MAGGKKQVKQRENVSGLKKPKQVEEPRSFLGMYPTWSFRLLDNDYDKWGFVHAEDLYTEVISKLKEHEGHTWGDIIRAAGGRSHGTNSHYEDVSKLIPEAQKRWLELHLEEYDRVFSLRLTGKHRLYGILEDGIFCIVWYDQEHEIYAMDK